MTMDAEVARTSSQRERTARFVRHYVEMVLAMLLGMVLLHPVWTLLVGALGDPEWTRLVEVDLAAMTVGMAVPMVAWMRIRGHGVRPSVEMTLAMAAGFAVLLPLLWADALGADAVMGAGHVLMLLAMLGAMLCRREEYAGCVR